MISKPLSTFESCCSCCRRRRPMWQMNEYRAPPPEGCDPVWCSTVTPVPIPIPVVSAAKQKESPTEPIRWFYYNESWSTVCHRQPSLLPRPRPSKRMNPRTETRQDKTSVVEASREQGYQEQCAAPIPEPNIPFFVTIRGE